MMNKRLMEKIKQQILATNGKFFTVIFTKRSDGATRKMICRTKKRTGNAPYDADNYFLIHVWDVQVRDWRSIPLEGVSYFKCGKIVHRVQAVKDARKKFLARVPAAVKYVGRITKPTEPHQSNV